MPKESKADRAAVIRFLIKEKYDRRFIDLLQKWKSENVSVIDGFRRLLEENKKTQPDQIFPTIEQTLHHYQG